MVSDLCSAEVFGSGFKRLIRSLYFLVWGQDFQGFRSSAYRVFLDLDFMVHGHDFWGRITLTVERQWHWRCGLRSS